MKYTKDYFNNIQVNVLNLTQHIATPEQVKEGVIEPSLEDKESIKKLLTFDTLEDADNLTLENATKLAIIAEKYYTPYVMIGGAPFFIETLKTALISVGLIPVFAFSERKVIENINVDSNVTKIATFVHKGFLKA